MNQHKISILLVEDNQGDVILTQEALDENGINYIMKVASNGQEAIDFLIHDNLNPEIIFMDINLPLKNGFEILERIKTEDTTRHIPVIMLTTSSAPGDIKKAYSLHANSYICKANDPEELIRSFRIVKDYWMSFAKLPSSSK